MWTALLGDEVIDARLLDESELDALLKERPPIVCRSCKGGCHVRDNTHNPRLGLPIGSKPFITFAHNPGNKERCQQMFGSYDESPQHYMLKDKLAKAAVAAGYDAQLEVPSDGCRADVVATKNGRTHVLEAQCAEIGMDEAITRTNTYQREFGDTTWAHTKARRWSQKVPALQVDEGLDKVVAGIFEDQGGNIPSEPAPIHTSFKRLLTGELRYVFFQESGTTIGYYTPIGAKPTARHQRKRKKSGAGDHVRECRSADLACSQCGHAKAAGTPCVNPDCAPRHCAHCKMPLWPNQFDICHYCSRFRSYSTAAGPRAIRRSV